MEESDDSSSSSSCSEDNDDADEECLQNFIFYLFVVDPTHFKEHARAHNIYRDREGPLNFIMSWSDEMFQRQFRLCKEDFNELFEKMKDGYPGKKGIDYLNYLDVVWY